MIGEEIREARLKKGWTQGQLARRIKRSQATVSLVESGQSAPHEVIEKLAEVLGIPLEKLKPSQAIEIPLQVPDLLQQRKPLPLPLRVLSWRRPTHGGDFLLVLPLPRQSVLVVAVDVVGHGVAALPKSLLLQGWLLGWVSALTAPPRLDALAQDFLAALSSIDSEAAFYFALLQQQGATTLYEAVSESFPAPLLIAGPPFRTLDSIEGPGSEQRFQIKTQQLTAPWKLVISTDGLLQRLGARSEREGLKFMLRWQQSSNRELPPEEKLGTTAPLSDDESFLLIEWNGWDENATINGEDDDERHRLLRVIQGRASTVVGEVKSLALVQSLAEALLNTRQHVHRGAGSVTVRYRSENNRCRVEVEDPGKLSAQDMEKKNSGFAVMRKKVSMVEARSASTTGTILTLLQEK